MMGEKEGLTVAESKIYHQQFGDLLIYYLQNKSRDSCIKFLKEAASNEYLDKKSSSSFNKVLHCMIAEDYHPNCIRAIIQTLSLCEPATPPLHQVARGGAHSLAQLFLDYGQDPNLRADDSDDPRKLKQALPLEFALTCFSYEKERCAFKLVCSSCASEKRSYLETARLLALQTKDLEKEIFKFVKEGKVQYLCALMLLGYYTQIPSVECFEGDESTKKLMLELVEIFQRIGDKLQVYVKLPKAAHKLKNHGRVVSDIASLFFDAGLPVKSIHPRRFHDRFIFSMKKENDGSVGEDNRLVREVGEVNKAPLSNLHGVQELNGSHVHVAYDNNMWSCRSLHTKVHNAHSSSSSSFKGFGYVLSRPGSGLMPTPFWKNSSFWMIALRRAIRHV